MFNWFSNLSVLMQALLATTFTWSITALGAALVFLVKKMNKNIMDGMLGLSAGIMIAASFWSLLDPAIEMAKNLKMKAPLVALVGFMIGGILLYFGDKLFDKLQYKRKKLDNIKNKDSFKRSLLLIFSITLHNIPEGLAVGCAFGSLAYGINNATLMGALLLALGIGIQNFPEGTAVSFPLLREGFSKKKAFFYGQLSGFVEPVAGFLGALLVLQVRFLLPYLLAFAAGAMIFVVVQELIPESQTNNKKPLITLFTMIGFAIMMFLDVALG